MTLELLAPNQPPRTFPGGPAIAQFRGIESGRIDLPEDWVASTTTLHGEARAGLSRLSDGRWLRDAVAADPDAWLGADHVGRWGADPGLLVKLLDAAERLPVHVHPNRAFAGHHLDCDWGKTEAWVVLGAEGANPAVHLGFTHDVARDQLDEWVSNQRVAAIFDAMHTVPVAVGDTVMVPAGAPHSIGAGVFVLELQEPTDFSIMLEWETSASGAITGDGDPDVHLGLGVDLAMDCVDRTAWSDGRLAELRSSRRLGVGPSTSQRLLPVAADPYFRADVVRGPWDDLEASFTVLVAVEGSGTVATSDGDEVDLRHGELLLVPYAAGRVTISEGLEVVRCRPPDPTAPVS